MPTRSQTHAPLTHWQQIFGLTPIPSCRDRPNWCMPTSSTSYSLLVPSVSSFAPCPTSIHHSSHTSLTISLPRFRHSAFRCRPRPWQRPISILRGRDIAHDGVSSGCLTLISARGYRHGLQRPICTYNRRNIRIDTGRSNRSAPLTGGTSSKSFATVSIQNG